MFTQHNKKRMSTAPLAERMRPKTLANYVGQESVIGENSPLRRALNSGFMPSVIFWGPPGVGKTTLANILASELKRPFYALSAINSGVKDVREVIEKASKTGMFSSQLPILFIDEIHRFSKSQQDSLLGAVEKGIVTLVGATTENPSFEVISALLSRCQVYVLEHLSADQLKLLIQQAIQQDEQLRSKSISVVEYDALFRFSGGDGRKLLNAFELVVNAAGGEKVEVTNELVQSLITKNTAIFDKTGEAHYDIISAFIKSIRGSDPNAAVYWLARMIAGGEDPKFIARRLLISASEDIGLANPTALVIANETFKAVEVIGYPECEIILSQCAVYLATSPKSNASYKAIKKAKQLVAETGDLPVPLALRNAPTKLMKDLDYGAEYKYSHDFPGNFVQQEFLPNGLQGLNLLELGDSAREQEIKKKMQFWWGGKY